ncbi:MAG: bifunctional 3-deoxy-7-phosphoheptulonate synthase/chorismate mutase type II [Cyclobacteriaceae bacterium]|nr:bifunctional 3-deoxy-7-phosphoheptulonate synthase/chorismate mutase type II [Cyclobacteriaceae bacterium]
MKIENLKDWGFDLKRPWIIAGPCSVETEEQLLDTSKQIQKLGINIIRGGVWKPRTRPDTFEGVGSAALPWIQNVKKETGLSFMIEVGNPKHVEEALKHDIDILWIGARSTVNPFTVQEIAEAIRGVDIPVLVKNPINPDLALWIGAIERISRVGISRIAAIHRGFSSFQNTRYRNLPMWSIPIDLKRNLPEIPMICDPSHIGGSRDLIFEISQKAIDLDYDGLIIESHRDPDRAWSDAKQQITPTTLALIMKNLKYRTPTSEDKDFITQLEGLRDQIDHIDKELFEIMAQRMDIVEEIGLYKKRNNVTVFQKDRWKEIYETRRLWAAKLNLNPEFMADLFKIIHDASIRRQEYIMNNPIETTEDEKHEFTGEHPDNV